MKIIENLLCVNNCFIHPVAKKNQAITRTS